jgi:hypothetical protein
LLSERLEARRRWHPPVIGPVDGFLLFLRWLWCAASIAKIAAAFELNSDTLQKRLHEVAEEVHDVLVGTYITEQAGARLPRRQDLPGCELIVDATAHDRRRPVGRYQQAQKYFSGKHHTYHLKLQVVTNRDGLAVHVVPGVPGAQNNIQSFRDGIHEIEQLVAMHEGDPCHILADKGYVGEIPSDTAVLMTAHKPAPGYYLSQQQLRENQLFSRHRVLVENFFGRVVVKFYIMVRTWVFADDFYPAIFPICCALVNFDLRQQGDCRCGGRTAISIACT